MKAYLWNILVWLDNGANVLLHPLLNVLVDEGGARFGNPDETLSSVFGKNVRTGTCRFCFYMCRLLHLLDPDHCQKSIEDDESGEDRR